MAQHPRQNMMQYMAHISAGRLTCQEVAVFYADGLKKCQGTKSMIVVLFSQCLSAVVFCLSCSKNLQMQTTLQPKHLPNISPFLVGSMYLHRAPTTSVAPIRYCGYCHVGIGA